MAMGLEILGAVAASMQLAEVVIKVFGTHRNAPRQVQRLQRMLNELHDEELMSVARPREKETIRELIIQCNELLQKHVPRDKGGTRQFMSFLWPAAAEENLRLQNDEISHELNRLIARLASRSPRAPSPRPGPSAPSQGLDLSPTVPPRRPSVQKETLESIQLPAELTLQRHDGTAIRPPIRLHRLNILERDDTVRTLQYEGVEGSDEVRITHRIPRGNIRFEDDDVNDVCVSFLDAHDVTIENSKGYHIRRALTIYRFDTVNDCDEFLVKVREREILSRWSVRCVRKDSASGEILAQEQVVRLWRKTIQSVGSQQPHQKVTVSFLGRGARTYELPLVDYFSTPTQDNDRIYLADLQDRSCIIFEFHARPRHERRRSSLNPLRSSPSPVNMPPSDADNFLSKLVEFHPSNASLQLLPAPDFARRGSGSRDGGTTRLSRSSDASTNLTWSSTSAASSATSVVPRALATTNADICPNSPPPSYVIAQQHETLSQSNSFAAEVDNALFGLGFMATDSDHRGI